MTEMPLMFLLLAALVWPLLLAMAAGPRFTRPLALRLAPWAALPALAAVALPNTVLQLGGVMLGGALALDAIGRVFLLSMAGLWLATGLLARQPLRASDSAALAVLTLLAMAGGLGMALVGDALWFYAASTLTGYALYGVLVQAGDGATRQAGRVFVVLLVASDLLVFEALLMLAHSAVGTDFAAFRQAFLAADNRALLLGLLVIGFGTKIGLLGVHFWLAPVFATATPLLRPAVVAYMVGAGLLGALRLLPLGDLNAPDVGAILRWLAWATLGYAWVAGMMQSQRRSILAYAAMAMGGLWLAVLSALLQRPGLWQATAHSLSIMVVQSGFALAALLLAATAAAGRPSRATGRVIFGLRWLAAVFLATAPTGIVGGIPEGATAMLASAVIAFLAAASLMRRDTGAGVVPAGQNTPAGTAQNVRSDMPMPPVLMVAAGLTVAAAFAFAYQAVGWSVYEAAIPASVALMSLLLGALSARIIVARLPSLPPGDVAVWIGYAVAAIGRGHRRLNGMGLTRWSDVARLLARRVLSGVSRVSMGQWESALIRWPTALFLMLLLGLLVAWLASGRG